MDRSASGQAGRHISMLARRRQLAGVFAVAFFCLLSYTSAHSSEAENLAEGAVVEREEIMADMTESYAEVSSKWHTGRTLLGSKHKRRYARAGFRVRRSRDSKDRFVSGLAAAWHTFQHILRTNVGRCNKNMKDIAGGNFKDLLTLSRKAYGKRDKHLAGSLLNKAISATQACADDLKKNKHFKPFGRVMLGLSQLKGAAKYLNRPTKSKPKPKPKPRPKPRPRAVARARPTRSGGGRGEISGNGNPIDACWMQGDWRNNPKRLADCSFGYGRNFGGKSGASYVVTDSSDGGDFNNPRPGTLRAAMKVAESRSLWITFASDMVINLKQEILVRSDITIDGRGRNVHITGGQLTVKQAKNVIISNLQIHDVQPQDTIYGQDRSKGDCIYIFDSHHIWLDHLTLYNCDGEIINGIPQAKLIGVIAGSYAVTISNTKFSEAMFTILLGASDANDDSGLTATVAFNYFGPNLNQRMPRTRQGHFHVANNYYDKWGDYAIGGSGSPNVRSEGNVFIAGDNPTYKRVCSIIDATNGDPKYPWGKNAQWQSIGDDFRNGAFFLDGGRKSLGDGIFSPPYDKYWVLSSNAVEKATSNAGWMRL